jgi:TRAP-type C4-dicarboxylate transport system substrate-binding protein
MNGAVYDKLGDDQKAALNKAMIEAQKTQREYDRAEDAKYRQIMIDAGEKINEVDPEPFKKLADTVRMNAIKSIGDAAQRLYDKIESCR